MSSAGLGSGSEPLLVLRHPPLLRRKAPRVPRHRRRVQQLPLQLRTQEHQMSEKLIAGLDEVGWGSAAGPLVSVVAVLKESDMALIPKGVTDSKRLTWMKREAFFLQLCAAVTDVGLGSVEPWEIDKMGPKF